MKEFIWFVLATVCICIIWHYGTPFFAAVKAWLKTWRAK